MWLLDGIAKIPASEARVSDLTLDSRQVREGSLFFALPGLNAHGLKFAADAAARGASVVLWEPDGDAMPPALPPGVFAAAVPNLKNLVGRIAELLQLAFLASAHRGHHGHQWRKTTCAICWRNVWSAGSRGRVHGHHWLGTPGGAGRAHPHDARCGHVARTLAQLRASGARSGDGGL